MVFPAKNHLPISILSSFPFTFPPYCPGPAYQTYQTGRGPDKKLKIGKKTKMKDTGLGGQAAYPRGKIYLGSVEGATKCIGGSTLWPGNTCFTVLSVVFSPILQIHIFLMSQAACRKICATRRYGVSDPVLFFGFCRFGTSYIHHHFVFCVPPRTGDGGTGQDGECQRQQY